LKQLKKVESEEIANIHADLVQSVENMVGMAKETG
jgi:hypothetical protein